MNVYNIYLQDGRSFEIGGELITVCDTTGQSIIYSDRNIAFANILAIVPASAFITVSKSIET